MLRPSTSGDRNTPPSLHLYVGLAIVLGLTAATAWSYLDDGIVGILLRPGVSSAGRVGLIQEYFRSWGAIAPVAYVVVVTVEVVVAPIPGLMLYAPGGLSFGGFLGGLLALIGNVLGAGVTGELMRILGRSRLEWMWETERLKALDRRFSAAGVWIVFALRVNPLTSSDLVSYAAGLTSVPTWKVMAGTLLGMAPLCFAQAYLADELLSAYPDLIVPLLGVCVVYVVVVVVALRKLFGCRNGLVFFRRQ